MPALLQPLWPRLLERRRIEGDCWIYTGNTTPEGYGHISYENRVQPVHRLAYESAVGPIPDELHLDHLCRRPSCFNPQHLEPVTCRENLLRGDTAAARLSNRTHCDNGHPFDDDNTLIRADGGGRKCRRCHADYMRAYRARKAG